jgi:UDP-N-acetylglucosamine 2-epimerase (non-hydrolysing)
MDSILSEVKLIIEGKGKLGKNPRFWDGNTANRIVELLESMD